MVEPESNRLAELSEAIRGSSLKRLSRVPVGKEDWRPVDGAMSFADLARHLLESDRWLFRKLAEPDLPAMKGRPGANGTSRADYLQLLDSLREAGSERASLISCLEEVDLQRRMPDDRFGGEATVWWIIVRGTLDHEAHHRGQIAAYLRILGGT